MNEFAGAIVLCRIIAEEPEINEVGCSWQKFERGKIAFVQRTCVGPNPTDAAILEQSNDLRSMPAGVTKFDGKSKVFRKLNKKLTQKLAAILRRERRRQLNQYDLQLRFERLDCAQK